MSDLPKLVKPYYTIEETFNRLKLAGAHLDNSRDVFLLAREGTLEIKLLFTGKNTLINKKDVEPYFQRSKYRFTVTPSKELIDNLVSEDEMPIDMVESVIEEANEAFYVVPTEFATDEESINCYVVARNDDEIFFPDSGDYIDVNLNSPLLVSPVSMHRYKYHAEDKYTVGFCYIDLAWDVPDSHDNRLPLGVEYGGEVYYVCKEDPFSKLFICAGTKAKLKDGRLVGCHFILDSKSISSLIANDKNRVVSIESLKAFEKKYLNIEHGDVEPKQPKNQTMQNLREQALNELITQHGLSSLVERGRLGVWQELTSMNNKLFSRRDNAEDSTLKKFFDNQNLISFKRGR